MSLVPDITVNLLKMPASQAGRRRFESGLPLHVFKHLQEIEIPSILSIKRLSHSFLNGCKRVGDLRRWMSGWQ